ncbi:MAG: N-acetylmuramoyl-L-alanine amidase [Oscillospiraceae bacterium]|nr:N-acetylmuramoyl-L-alanine amidase [Oscillospiraceae bacterium]
MNQQRMFTRFGAFLLCICLCLACMSASAFRSDAEEADTRSPLPVSYGKPYQITLSGCSPTSGWTDTGKQLTDRAFGSGRLTADDAGNWTGYTSNGGNFTVQILLDLGMVYGNLRHFTVSFLQNTGEGIYFPGAVRYEVSTDGKRFTSLGEGECDCDLDADPYCGLFNLTLQKDVEARYVRININGGAGQSVFLCEVIAEGRAQLTRIGKQAAEGTEYTDEQGVVYTLQNGEAVVTGYRDTALTSQDGTLLPSDANFSREGDYILGAGSKNPVTVHAEFIPQENINFSRLSNDIRAIVIHNTATVEESTTASLYHGKLLRGNSDSSWHYTVDDGGIIYHSVPDEYAAWHAGSDENYASIGIELCVNGAPTAGGTNFIFKGEAYERWVEERFRKTIENTAVLVAELLIKYDLPESAVLQHNDCSGKNCPQWMRYCSSDGKYRREGDLWIVLMDRIHEYYTALSANAQAFTPAEHVVLPEYLLFTGGISAPVTKVASGAFAGKGPVLRSIFLPDTVTKVAPDAFTDTASLEAVTVSPSHPTLSLRGAELYDKNGTLLFSPKKTEETVPSPREDSGLWVEEHDGEYWLLGLPGPCDAETLRLLYGAEELRLYANAVGTGAFVMADGAPMRIVLQGDATGDGAVGATDYMLTKRTVLGSYHPAPIFARAMMITNGKTVGAVDYLILKRCVLGTFSMPKPIRSN